MQKTAQKSSFDVKMLQSEKIFLTFLQIGDGKH
jgi:hypothetical protein